MSNKTLAKFKIFLLIDHTYPKLSTENYNVNFLVWLCLLHHYTFHHYMFCFLHLTSIPVKTIHASIYVIWCTASCKYFYYTLCSTLFLYFNIHVYSNATVRFFYFFQLKWDGVNKIHTISITGSEDQEMQ